MDKERKQVEIVPTLLLDATQDDEERAALITISPVGFHIRHPPKPHQLQAFITPDEDLFETIHMGTAVVDPGLWKLTITGLVGRPFSVNLKALRQLRSRTITSFHECYGSPVKPPVSALWRIGNVRWTGVPLKDILRIAKPSTGASYVWSEGLDHGEFAGVKVDRYQKDLPMDKAMSEDVLLAYEMNGEPLRKERGGPVRLVVPGWFGTNSTKWISKIELQDHRAPGPYTTTFYNEQDPGGPPGAMRPVWQIEPNSMIVRPAPDEELYGPDVVVHGWAWSADGIDLVQVTHDGGDTWLTGTVDSRTDSSWQKFTVTVSLRPGCYTLTARATSLDGQVQPLQGRRNHCHSVLLRGSTKHMARNFEAKAKPRVLHLDNAKQMFRGGHLDPSHDISGSAVTGVSVLESMASTVLAAHQSLETPMNRTTNFRA